MCSSDRSAVQPRRVADRPRCDAPGRQPTRPTDSSGRASAARLGGRHRRHPRHQPPRRRDRPQHGQPGDRRQPDVHPDHVGGQVQLVLDAADEPLRGQQHPEHGERLERALARAAVAAQQPHAHDRHAEQRRDRRVPVDRPHQRVGALEVQAVDALAREAAGVRAGGGRRGPGEDRQRAERRQRPDRPDGQPVAGPRPRARLVGAAPRERHRRDQNEHRQREVRHHEAGREVLADREPAEHRLCDHEQRQAAGEPREVAAERLARERQHRGDDGHHSDHPGDGAVAELDQRVRAERRQRASPALGPVRAPEARVGQPDGRAGQHDQRSARRASRRRRGGTGRA